jgi:uncharacterized protein (TIGR02646 family)
LIHIERDRTDEQGWPIWPDDAWFKKAATSPANADEVDPAIYADDRVKAALEQLFHEKCAYCETKITASADWDVEHFRPKGKVAERPSHSGYYWLAYAWSNLFPSCQHCNQRRKDRPRWGDLRYAGARGKKDQFPLGDEGTRAMGSGDELKREARLLLDPCEDHPEGHLRYTVNGQIVAVAGDQKGTVSIEVFHLARRRLRVARQDVIAATVSNLKLIWKYEAEGRMEVAADFRRLLETFLLADRCQYAGAARAVVRDPEAFGVYDPRED